MTAATLLGYTAPSQLVIVGVASLLPDIDRSNSLLGRFIPVLPSLIEQMIGKRTVTHSLVFGGIIAFLLHEFADHSLIPFLIGFLSHVILDLPTGQIVLLWPLPFRFSLTFGVPPVFIEAVFLTAWGGWLALGGYSYFISIFQGGITSW